MTKEHLACVISTLVVRRRPKPTRRVRLPYTALFAVVAELVDALSSGASVRWNVGGRVPPAAIIETDTGLGAGPTTNPPRCVFYSIFGIAFILDTKIVFVLQLNW